MTSRKTTMRTSNHARGDILNITEEVKTAHSILSAYIDELQKEIPGTVVSVKVSF